MSVLLGDDEPKKLRRNVVVASAVVLATAFIGMDLREIFPDMAVKLAAIPPWKGWLLSLAVLVYVTLRYHFDEETDKQRKAAAELLIKYKTLSFNDVIQNLATSAIFLKNWNCGFEDKFRSDFEEMFKKNEEANIRIYEVSAQLKEGTRLDRQFLMVQVGVEGTWPGAPNRLLGLYKLSLPRLTKLWCMGRAVVSYHVFSKASIDYLVPYYLAAIAKGYVIASLLIILANKLMFAPA